MKTNRLVRLMERITLRWRLRRKPILLLDDDTSMQRLVVKLLRPLRRPVEIFGTGRDALEEIAADNSRYDALLLDLMMPHEGGLTVLRHLRDKNPLLLKKVILLTGSGSAITDPWAPLVFAVVHKPFDGSALVTTVKACVGATDETAIRPTHKISR
jgi:CheY-like chemotaxis protein